MWALGKTFDNYRDLLVRVLEIGDVVDVERGGKVTRTHEIFNANFQLDPESALIVDPGRHFNLGLAFWEFSTLVTGNDDLEGYLRFSPNFGRFSTSEKKFSGSYAPRTVSAIPLAIQKLRRTLDTRQAIVGIFENGDLAGPWKDVRCAVSVQFLFRGGFLHAIVTMRSNDAYLGFMTDQAMFSFLLQFVSAAVGVEPGFVFWNAASFHLYHYHIKKVEKMEGTPNIALPEMPKLTPYQLAAFERAFLRGLPLEADPYLRDMLEVAKISSGGSGSPKHENLKTWAESFK